MNTNMLITSAMVAIFCLVAISTVEFVRKDNCQIPGRENLVMTDLWKEYSSAQKADPPKEMATILDAIISKAKAERLNYDFYTAANRKVEIVGNRDWKLREE